MTSRHREEVILNDLYPYSCKSYYGSYGSCTVDAGNATTLFTFYQKSGDGKHSKNRAMDDVVTPDFQRLKSKGIIVNNPMIKTLVEEFDPVSSIDVRWISQKWGCTPAHWYNYQRGKVSGNASCMALTSSYLDMTQDLTALKDIAMNKAWAKIGEAEILALVSIAEFDSCVKGFADLLRKVVAIYRAIRRGNLRKLRGEISPKELADLYMNARYNLRPTYYDAIGLLNALKKSIEDVPRRQTYRAQISDSWTSMTNTNTTLMGTGGWNVKVDIKKMVTIDVKVRAGVLADLDQLMKSQFFGFDQLSETLWDLVPFSFIIDWFFNVGDIIGAFSPDTGVNVLASWIVVEQTKVQTNTLSNPIFTGTTYGGYNYVYDSMAVPSRTAYKVTTLKERVPNYSRSIIPRFNLRLDPLKLLDLGIILRKGRNVQSYVKAGM